MDESVKQKIKIGIAIAAGAVIIVGGIVYWWRIKHPAAQTPATTEVTAPKKGTVEPAAGVSTGTTQTKVSETTPPTDSKEAQLKRWALDFVARFGTYSTDGQSANLQQLLPLMSGDLKVWAQTHLSSPTKLGQAFSGVTTKALSVKIISQTTSAATVVVSTQRSYLDSATAAPRITYEDAAVVLTSLKGEWSATSVMWAVRPQ